MCPDPPLLGVLYALAICSSSAHDDRVKRWVIQSFLTFDSVDRTLKCAHLLDKLLSSWFFNFTQFVILEKLSSLDFRLVGSQKVEQGPKSSSRVDSIPASPSRTPEREEDILSAIASTLIDLLTSATTAH